MTKKNGLLLLCFICFSCVFSQTTYEEEQQMIENIWKKVQHQIVPMDMKRFEKPFYQMMKGTFNGNEITIQFHFGRINFEGKKSVSINIFDHKTNEVYEGWGDIVDTLSYVQFYNSPRSLGEKYYRFRGSFSTDWTEFNGFALNSTTMQTEAFSWQKTTGSVNLDIEDCFFNVKYHHEKDDESDFSIIYANETLALNTKNDSKIYDFWKDSFRTKEPCETYWKTFKATGDSSFQAVLQDYSVNDVRNRYLETDGVRVFGNSDDLLTVQYNYFTDTELVSYALYSCSFKTYDLKRNRMLTFDDVFLQDTKKLANCVKAVKRMLREHLEVGDEKEQNEEEVLENISFDDTYGFTSKGFFILLSGNHGIYNNPFFVDYKIVEPFLTEDFKKNYWKK